MYWIHNGKGNKEAGIICFEARFPRKKIIYYHGTIPSKIDGSNVRYWALCVVVLGFESTDDKGK